MANKRVIAFTMHEGEIDAAARAMPGAEVTEGFVVGELDDAAIAALRSQGLVVQEIDTPEPSGPPPPATPPWVFTAGESPLSRPPSDAPPQSPRYQLRLKGPLLSGWRDRLEALGVDIVEALPGYALRVRIPLNQVPSVAGLDFLAAPPQALMTSAAVLPHFGAGLEAPGHPAEVQPYDVLLTDAGSREPFLQWLSQRQVTIAGAAGRKVRLHAADGSPILDEIRSLVDWVERVEPFVPPRLHNEVARRLLGLDPPEGSNPGDSVPYEGAGQVIAVADTGLDEAHPDFAGRIAGVVALGRPNDASDPHGHGTHVAGSVLGDGSASGGRLRGAAPQARLFFQSLLDRDGGLGGLPFDLGDLFDEAYAAGARIHNNSWGAATASRYPITSQEVDEFVHRQKDMLIIISAGNEGSAADPATGGRNARPGFVDWLSVGSPATCKNALTVGASRSARQTGGFAALTYGEVWPDDFPAEPMASTPISGDPEGLSGFSSRGPCDDYRIKPDLVAPGTDILSCRSSRAPLRSFWGTDPASPHYAFMGGTSMSAPLVAGCAAVVREYYEAHRGHTPSAALLKATLINGTRWLAGSDARADFPDLPNYHQGFGAVHLPTTIPTPADPAFGLEFFDNWSDAATWFGQTGRRLRFRVRVTGGPLRICLAYTDPPGRGIQNNLDLLLQAPGGPGKRFGNERVPRGFNGPDPTNNVEVIRYEEAPPGDYLLQVTATNILRPPQDFALVVAGRLGSPLTAD